MVLMSHGPEPELFMLPCWHSKPGEFRVVPWVSGDITSIPDGEAEVPSEIASVITDGVPLPRSNLFGWLDNGTVTMLIDVRSTTESPDETPAFSPMPRASMPRDQWPGPPPFPLLGACFGDGYDDGRIADTQSLIAATDGVMFWAD